MSRTAPSSMRIVLGLLAGALWGALGFALAGQALGPAAWVGLAVAPVIGLAVALLFRGFSQHAPAARLARSLLSLYLSSGLFALAAGVADALRPIPHRDPLAVVIQTVLGVWWGVTFTGLLPVLWALAYVTHALLARADGPRDRAEASSMRES